MNKRHKHADVIIAWAEGKPVQLRSDTGDWATVPVEYAPPFSEDSAYRIKPAPVLVVGETYLFGDNGNMVGGIEGYLSTLSRGLDETLDGYEDSRGIPWRHCWPVPKGAVFGE